LADDTSHYKNKAMNEATLRMASDMAFEQYGLPYSVLSLSQQNHVLITILNKLNA
jgi:hypothetical protein